MARSASSASGPLTMTTRPNGDFDAATQLSMPAFSDTVTDQVQLRIPSPRIARRCPGRRRSRHAFRLQAREEGSGPKSAILASGAINQTLREQLQQTRAHLPFRNTNQIRACL